MNFASILSIYFPVAEVQLNPFIVLLIGFSSGILSGLLGIGGGFISTPLLTSIGVSPPVAVATSAHQIIGASFSSILPRLRPRKVDFKLGFLLAFSGIVGAFIGAYIFNLARQLGELNIVIACFYIVLMSFISFINFKNYFKRETPCLSSPPGSKKFQSFKTESPRLKKIYQALRINFKVADVECFIFTPILLGIFTGMLVVIMGVGGGFILVPAMISIMKIKNDIAVGTSLLQIFLITIIVVVFHIFKTGLLDILLGTFLIAGAATGAQLSSIISLKIGKKKIISLILALLTLSVAIKFGSDLFFYKSGEKILIEEL